jgi:hypothetical protein
VQARQMLYHFSDAPPVHFVYFVFEIGSHYLCLDWPLISASQVTGTIDIYHPGICYSFKDLLLLNFILLFPSL